MKIAIASDNNKVTEHFGHCEGFIVYKIDNGNIISKEMIQNPGHKPGFLPVFLHEKGVNTIISGGMGGGAVDLFNENNIEVIIGAKGLSDDVLESYLSGNLECTGSVCHDHGHHE